MASSLPITALYADGGCIAANPSPHGGTWAYRLVAADGTVVGQSCGIIAVRNLPDHHCTNNVSEFYAVVQAMSALPFGWSGRICSDSRITLDRIFRGAALRGVPKWLILRGSQEMRRIALDRCTPVLLDGHPTKKQLAAGVGKRGNPVSEHNVWCDRACTEQAKKYLETAVPR